jgi:hypothetical protein
MVYEVNIYCDGCGAYEPTQTPGVDVDIREAGRQSRTIAERQGWKRIGHKWLCVTCQKQR